MAQAGQSGGAMGGLGQMTPGAAPAAQPNMSNNTSGANASSGKPQGMSGMAGGAQQGMQAAQGPAGLGSAPNPAAQAPTPNDPGWGNLQGHGGPGTTPSGPTPFQQGQSMYSMPFMQSGLGGGQQGGLGSLAQGIGPYSYQGLNPQQGYNSQAVTQGMQGYLTPVPQRMPQSPYLAGQQWGVNGPPVNPGQGTDMPLSPMQTGMLPQSTPGHPYSGR
jgi:hypothetical protein